MYRAVPEESAQTHPYADQRNRHEHDQLGGEHCGIARVHRLESVLIHTAAQLRVRTVQRVLELFNAVHLRLRGVAAHRLLVACFVNKSKTTRQIGVRRRTPIEIDRDGEHETAAAEHVRYGVHKVAERAVMRRVHGLVGVGSVQHAVEAVEKVAQLEQADAELAPEEQIRRQESDAEHTQHAV